MYTVILLVIIMFCLFWGSQKSRYRQYGGGEEEMPHIAESTKNFMKSALLAECMDPDNTDAKVMEAAKEFGLPTGTREETCQRLVDHFVTETLPQ